MPKALRASNARSLSEKRSERPLSRSRSIRVLGVQVFNNHELLRADPAGEQEHDESDW
jgi:hypothetical protein